MAELLSSAGEQEFEDVPPPPAEDAAEDDIQAPEVKKKKGNWKTIGTTPATCATYPCECRWRLRFPREPCPKYKQIRWIPLPLSDRISRLSLPLLRRLLALWLQFGDKFPPEMRARLKAFLMENYGLTEEFLEELLEKARKENEPPPPPKEKKKKKRKGKKKKSKKKEKKEKKEKPKEPEEKPKEEDNVLGFKRRKAGKLPLDWPYKTGSRFILMYTSYLSQDPDEDYNSRATEYFDVQSMAILEQICSFLDMPLPDPEKPTQYGETLVIMALNLSNWIAKWVVTPAQEIPDDKVDEYMDLRGVPPKPKKDKQKQKKEKPKKEADKKQGKKKKGAEAADAPPPDEAETKRVWEELKSPTYVPAKTRISKRKPQTGDKDDAEEDHGSDRKPEKEDVLEEEEKGVPRWQKPTLDEVKKDFLEYLKWYNPWEPEFMYLGPKIIPKGVEMFKIWDADSDELPFDLRILNWSIVQQGYTEGYSFIPSPVPQYYPSLRPLRPLRLEDVERSGIPAEIIMQSLRLFSPWYIRSKAFKQEEPALPAEEPPPPPPPLPQAEPAEEAADADLLPETEETFDDEMLRPSGPPKVRDSAWGDYKMKEELEILGHILRLTASVPNLTIEHVFELLEEFCDAVECAESEENPSEENALLLKKRTIILERYYFNFFGKKFRDYNERTPYYMRKICGRFAYYIQLLYEHTASKLWELQSRPNRPILPEGPSEPPDDPQALQDWDNWLAWLLRVTRTCDEWAAWISETVDDAERKAAKKKGEYVGEEGKPERLTKREWTEWRSSVEDKVHGYRSCRRQYDKESVYYLEKSMSILSVKHRPIKRWEDETQDAEGDAEEEDAWENLFESEDERSRRYSAAALEEALADAEYEDTREMMD